MVGRCSGAVLFTGTCDWASCPHCPGAAASPAGGSSAPACSAYLHVEVVPLLVDAAHALQVRAAVEQQLLLLRPRQRHGVQAALPPQRVIRAADCGAEGCRREGSERCLVCLCVGVLQRLEGGPKHRQQLHTPPSQPTGCRRTLLPFNHEQVPSSRPARNLSPGHPPARAHSLLEKVAGSRLISSTTLTPSVRSAAWHSWQPRPTSWLSSAASSRDSGLAVCRQSRRQGWDHGAGSLGSAAVAACKASVRAAATATTAAAAAAVGVCNASRCTRRTWVCALCEPVLLHEGAHLGNLLVKALLEVDA